MNEDFNNLKSPLLELECYSSSEKDCPVKKNRSATIKLLWRSQLDLKKFYYQGISPNVMKPLQGIFFFFIPWVALSLTLGYWIKPRWGKKQDALKRLNSLAQGCDSYPGSNKKNKFTLK